ncbi:hypothetical protein HJC23_004888 [Cyclotella cryptica]|uniref:Nucleolar protein 12 n=1 Tax=Cyclotella cryptica TaxID=29204 RepID=A0ABD3P5T6_9STRA|eukprot:CCRYP_017546-RA/>CCRYP_017546-RA protein AED:0.38 eAED:0.38 QI:0/-1/0/1/-1/1/1/0/269
MGRNNRKSNNRADGKHNKPKPKGKHNLQHQSGARKKLEITFNPTDRVEYLTGFSSRKKERRAFGLAMQKVKDRQAKIEERKDKREAQLEKVEEIERSKAELRRGIAGDDDGEASDNDGEMNEESKPLHRNQHTFQDEHTQNHFGGLVSVTTTFGILSDDDESTSNAKLNFFEREEHGTNHIDTEQRKAGNVQKYIAEVKGTMGGSKRKKTAGGKHNAGKKGQHGAATMKGMGNATTLKMAKKTLAKFKAKGDDERRGAGGKGKKRKGRR